MTRRGTDRRGISRREFLEVAGAGTGAMALALAGCSSDDSRGNGGTAGGATGEEIDLTFWLPGGEDRYLELHEEVAEAYSEDNANVNVSVSRLTGEQNFLEVLLARVAAGNPPSATVLWDTPVALGIRGSLVELGDFMASSQNSQLENWPEALLASCQFDGRTYGLPFTSGSYAMYYNQEWFEEQGIPADRDSFPKTWDELRDLSKELTRWNGDEIEAAGFLPPFDAYTVPIWSALNGGQIFDAANARYTIDSEANIEMMEYFLSWIDDEYRGDLQKVENTWTVLLGEEPPIFPHQRLAILMDGTWVMGSFYQAEPTFEGWEVARIPVGPGGGQTVSGYWPNWMAIPTASNNPEEAFRYLDHIAVEGAEAQFAEFPDLPTNANVPDGIVPNPLVERRGQEYAEDATAFFRDQLDIATPMWDSPVQTFAIDQLSRALERISTKADPPSVALAEAQTACQAELDSVL